VGSKGADRPEDVAGSEGTKEELGSGRGVVSELDPLGAAGKLRLPPERPAGEGKPEAEAEEGNEARPEPKAIGPYCQVFAETGNIGA